MDLSLEYIVRQKVSFLRFFFFFFLQERDTVDGKMMLGRGNAHKAGVSMPELLEVK